jgi:glycine/D-amino acid oxidase-like deaminating enzyme
MKSSIDSLYAHSARPAVPPPVLRADLRTSVVIVGAGFTGLATALHLAERGVDCTVIDAHEPGWGASGRNGGQVNPGLRVNPSVLLEKFGSVLGMRMVNLAWGAPDRLFQLIARYGIDCEARQGGSLRLAVTASFARRIEQAVSDERQFGHPVRLLSASECERQTGAIGHYACGMLDPRGGSVNPLGLARGLAEHAVTAGARIFSGTPALQVRREESGWAIRTPHAEVRAKKLVIATNGYTDDLWPGLRRSIVPVYTCIVSSASLSPEAAAAILPLRNVAYEIESLTTYYRLDAANRLLMGGVDRQREQAGVHEFQSLRQYVTRVWPALQGIRWEYGWNGKVAMTADYLPHVHEPAPGVVICLGYNGRGIAMGCAMGEQIALRLCDGEVPFCMPVTPLKALPFHWASHAAMMLRIEYGKFRDLIGKTRPRRKQRVAYRGDEQNDGSAE